jgi:endo-1,4-beta-D-glucanase Y/GGDEF domain-containing protein
MTIRRYSLFLLALLAAFVSRPRATEAGGFYDAAIVAKSGPVAIGGMLQGSPVWEAWRRRFVTEAGRVVDTGNGAFSHSEGQGYGLLLAAAAADRATFDRILAWTTLNLRTRKDSLVAWRWTGARRAAQDRHNASDGDILIAWALAEAADFWNDPAYLNAAWAMARDIAAKLVKPTRAFGPVIMPAAEGFGPKERPDGPVVNLSYWVFPAFHRLAQIDPSFDWSAVLRSGLDLVESAQFGRSKLPTDWLSLAKSPAAPAQGFEERFGYDALRIPLYLYWADAVTPGGLRVFDAAWSTGAAILGPQTDAGAGQALAEPGYQAVAALLRCSCQGAPYPESFYRFSENQHYYPATLHILSLIAATMRGGSCLDLHEMSRILSHNWQPRIGSLERLEADLEPAAYVQTPPEPVGYAAPPKGYAVAAEVRDMPQDADLFSYLRIIAGALTVLAGLYYLLSRPDSESGDERSDDQAAIGSAWTPAPGQYDVVPRTLPQNPFSDSNSLPALARELEAAAEASVRLSRTIGLIYFEFPAIAAVEADHGAQAADDLIAALAQDFRRAVRATDNVAILNGRAILVSICLLSGRKDLETIASRLTAAARRRDMLEEDGPSLPAGLAIYPLDGYSGLELIESAKRRYRELCPQTPEAPAPQIETTVAQPPRPPQARKRSRRRPARKTHRSPDESAAIT